MRFFESCARDPYKLCLFCKLLDSVAAAVAHARSDTANELVDGIAYRTLESNTSLNAFGNELFGVGLEVSVL